MITKIVLSTFFIAGVNLLARRYPTLAGYVAVLPVVTFLSLVTLMADKQSSENISTFLRGALSGVALTSLTLLLMLVMVRSGLAATYAVLLGMSLWAVVAYLGTRVFS